MAMISLPFFEYTFFLFLLIFIISPGLVHLSLWYPSQSMLKPFFTHVFQLECASVCYLRLKNQVSVGIMVVDNSFWYWVDDLSLKFLWNYFHLFIKNIEYHMKYYAMFVEFIDLLLIYRLWLHGLTPPWCL